MSHPRTPSTCLICGNIANCCHYGAVSCNCCKTFFRRQVLSEKKVSCAKGGKCKIETGLRLCRACRYEKCIKVGMSPRRVFDNMSRKGRNSPTLSLSLMDTPRDGAFDALLNNLLYIERKIKILRDSEYFPYSLTSSIEDFLLQPSPLNQTHDYHIITNWSKPVEWVMFSSDLAHLPYKLWSYVEIVLGIEFYKTFDFFNKLDHSDKLCLLRATLRQVRLFHSCYDSYFRGYKEICVDPDGYVPFAHPYYRGSAFDKFHKATCVSACDDVKMTIEKAVILKAIIALNHDAPNLSDKAKELITEERLKYMNTLMNVVKLESPCGTWFSNFVRLYSIVNRNIFATNCLTNLFFAKIFPLISTSTDHKLERIWAELIIE
ncbi:hypothetical protein QR680_006194 [Steinernema hermaphroditum]|uniref:Nuclear receptor domain-containing protein n=1 Tax=Steinernema hermaphroditum TaxID=289476 RepID=A0AA39HUM1_9BILA|nr:hypothetical protein QR680_006194 [Steinernema hermaphroditum]